MAAIHRLDFRLYTSDLIAVGGALSGELGGFDSDVPPPNFFEGHGYYQNLPGMFVGLKMGWPLNPLEGAEPRPGSWGDGDLAFLVHRFNTQKLISFHLHLHSSVKLSPCCHRNFIRKNVPDNLSRGLNFNDLLGS